MKFLLLTALAGISLAAPAKRAVNDVDILQYALTLEHLENEFYKEALSKFSKDDFCNAGFEEDYYTNLQYIAKDEADHVQLLTSALSAAGYKPVAACQYNFQFTDPRSFVTLSSVLEGVGTSAYLGGAGLIQSKQYLGVAGAILVTEALHTSLQRFNIHEIAPANPYGTGLGLNEVYTLAAAFIKSCPPSNMKLPLKAFPTLKATSHMPAAQGSSISFQAPKGSSYGQMYVTFLSGLDITSQPATMSHGMIYSTVPQTAAGQTYAVLTNQKVTGSLMDNMVVAGPAIVEVTPAPP